MRKAEKVEKISQILDEHFASPPHPFGPQRCIHTFGCVLLSAQCTDERVNLVTPGLFELADNAKDMAKLSVDQILEAFVLWFAPTKAKNVHKLSQILVEEYDGVVPDTLEQMEALPGVGHKTASVVMTQAFGIPAFPVDTHYFSGSALGFKSWHDRRCSGERLEKVFLKNIGVRYTCNLSFLVVNSARRGDMCPKNVHICSWGGVKTILARRQKPQNLSESAHIPESGLFVDE